MTDVPFVSLVIAIFNAEETLEDCIHSLLHLNYPRDKLELIAVDNASTDRTTAILDSHRKAIRILHESKRGPGAARNCGVRSAKGHVVAFTDSDCIVDKNWLRYLVVPLEDHRVGIVGGKILSRRPCNKIEEFGEHIHDHEKAICVYKPPYVITMNWAARLSVLREFNGFDEDFRRCEDVDLAYRICKAGYGFAYVPEAVIYHRNERTLGGLFREGFLHGYYSVQLLKKHQEFVRTFGHRSVNAATYLSLLSVAADYVRGKNRHSAACDLALNVGKKIGKMSGSLRYGHLEL